MSHAAAIDALLAPADGPVMPCPYLLSANGAWRSSSVSRDHRCAAIAPAAPLALDKQRRLCLVSAHVSCATYEAALAARRERGMPSDGTAPVRWAGARTTPVIDVGVGLGAAVSGLMADRRAWQAIPAIVLAVALVAVALSGLGRDEPLTGAVASSPPTLVPAPTRPPTPTPVPPLRASAATGPTGTPGAAA